MTEIKTIPNDAGKMTILYRVDFVAVCSVSNVPFHGKVKIEYQPNDVLLEFESFDRWLVEQASMSTTAEGFARFLYNTLKALLKPVFLDLTLSANTPVHGYVEIYVNDD